MLLGVGDLGDDQQIVEQVVFDISQLIALLCDDIPDICRFNVLTTHLRQVELKEEDEEWRGRVGGTVEKY